MIDIDIIKKQIGAKRSSDQPVFILSAGWRSGSTLMQRICTNRDRIIWGEPYGHSMLTSHLASPLHALTKTWPPESFFFCGCKRKPLAKSWIANLYPSKESLLRAYQAFFQQLFILPAHEAGYSQWGCKFVRLTADHAPMLRWLWPECKIIFLVRNPINAWDSYYRVTFGKCNWFLEWPEQQVDAELFARHWSNCVESFLNSDDGLLVRYEDLKDLDTRKAIQEHLGVNNVNFKAMQHVRGKSSRRIITPRETLETVESITNNQAEQLGYIERKHREPLCKNL